MNDYDVTAEIEERLSVRSMAAGRNHGHMSEMDAVEAHKDCAALLAIVKSHQEEIAALADDILRALETIAAENEARITAEKREAELRGALKYVLDVCPPINAQGEEAHERALSALAGGPA